MAFVINANSTPVYDGWGWADYWDCYDWVTWHKKMLPVYGNDETNTRFLQAWNKQDALFSGPVDCRSFNQDFIKYAKDNGFYDGLFSGIGFIAQPLSAGGSVIAGASDVVGNAADSAKDSSQYLKYVIPVVIIIILGTIIFVVFNKVKSTTKSLQTA